MNRYTLVYLIGGGMLAFFLALPITGLVAFFVPPVHTRRWLVLAAALFPFFLLFWIFAASSISSTVYENYLNRADGFGEIWHAPLPNGYSILFIKDSRSGAELAPTDSTEGMIFSGGVVTGVSQLQISGPYIFGISTASADDLFFTAPKYPKGTYFLLDTRTNKPKTFSSAPALLEQIKSVGVSQLNLESATTVYDRYFDHWFKYVSDAMLLIPPLSALLLLVFWGWRMRKSAVSPSV